MSDRLIGVVVTGNNTDEILGRIERSERARYTRSVDDHWGRSPG